MGRRGEGGDREGRGKGGRGFNMRSSIFTMAVLKKNVNTAGQEESYHRLLVQQKATTLGTEELFRFQMGGANQPHL